MAVTIDYDLQNKQDTRLRIDVETGLLITLLGLVLLVRITNILYNTLFVDEAIYISGGRDLLAGLNDRNILAWYGGSYIYPTLSAMAANLAGVTGTRLLSALLGTLAAILVYFTARQLFNRPAALWGLLVFGLAGGSISLGQFAVYDVLMLPSLAIALFCLVKATQLTDHAAWKYLLLGALAFSTAVLAKYTAIFYLPAVGLSASALYLIQRRWRGIVPLLIFFLLPVVAILSAYIVAYYSTVIQVFTGQQGFEAALPLVVAQNVSEEIGVAIVLALFGLIAMIIAAWRGLASTPALVVTTLSGYLQSKRKLRLMLVVAAALVLFTSFLLLPMYQIFAANIRSVWKAAYASLIFLAPLAGYLLARVIDWIRQLKRARILAAVLLTVLVVGWVSYDFDRNWGFQNSWPNVSGAIDYLRQHGLTKDSHVLAEAGAVYEDYFYPDFGLDGRRIWTDTWFMDYKGLQGTQAMTTAIADRYFDFIVVDDNYTPDVNQQIDTAAMQAGYVMDYRNVQPLTTGYASVVRVYTRGQQ